MKMRIPKVPIWAWAAVLLCVALIVARYRMGNTQIPVLTPEQKSISLAFAKDMAHNYTAVANNGSKRVSFPEDQVPARAREIAQQYHTIVYPAIKKYIAEHNGQLPINPSVMSPAIQTLLADHWAMSVDYRMDGTMTSHDVYSHNPPDAPHDPWAANYTFATTPGPWGRGFSVECWDDGRVTFTPAAENYYGVFHTAAGDIQGGSSPGSAGIPETAKQTLKLDPNSR